MLHPTAGNGSGNFNVHQQDDMGGWVRVFTDPIASVPENLATYLSHALTQWLRERPQLHLRAVVPVSRKGDTVELHAWYELHVFPDLSRPQPSTEEGLPGP